MEIGIPIGQVAHAEHALAPPNQAADPVTRARENPQRRPTCPLGELAQLRGERPIHDRSDHGERHLARPLPQLPADRIAAVAYGRQHGLRVREGGAPHVRQASRTGHALEQGCAHLRLEKAQPATDRRLGAVQTRRSPGEAARLDDRQERFDLLDVHRIQISIESTRYNPQTFGGRSWTRLVGCRIAWPRGVWW